jgi:hypothetical protein
VSRTFSVTCIQSIVRFDRDVLCQSQSYAEEFAKSYHEWFEAGDFLSGASAIVECRQNHLAYPSERMQWYVAIRAERIV